MASLKEVIQREVNPFDSSTFRTGNFWTENNQAAIETVESIHQEAIEEITEILNLVAKDHRTRTVLLAGDSGCGKSYSLGRLKKNLNSKAFFAYIDPAPSSDCIWQHTLRYTVDSLMLIPEGEQESQLLLWLKSLYAFNADNFKKKLLGQKRNFIQEMRATYPAGIYQPRDF
ncbi:MAG: ATP-binding protein, partial [Prochloraceae cyanobacterium]